MQPFFSQSHTQTQNKLLSHDFLFGLRLTHKQKLFFTIFFLLFRYGNFSTYIFIFFGAKDNQESAKFVKAMI